MVYSTKRFVLCLTLCYFVLVFFSPFSIAITSFGEKRANLSAFRMFFRFALVWFCLFPFPLGVCEGLWFVLVALPGLFSYLFSLRYKGSEVIKPFSCSTQLSMKFVLLINRKLTIANSCLLNIAEYENFTSNKYENANYCCHVRIY